MAIREVHYNPRSDRPRFGAEVARVSTLLRRGGHQEFTAPQRPGFELVIQILSGTARHDVDATTYPLRPGDMLWVHAGQVQRWGDIAAIDGRALLFPPGLLDSSTTEVLHGLGAHRRNHWPSIAADGSPLDTTLAALEATITSLTADEQVDATACQAATRHALASALLHLAGCRVPDNTLRPERDEVYQWLLGAIDDTFTRTRSVADYAKLLGYSTRTLNRSARTNAGLSAKQLIDRRVILEAERMLMHENTTVAEIARRLGFDDPANFSHYFRTRAGMSPQAFRTSTRR